MLRRPGALLSIVLGPLLILGLFGLGYTGQPDMRAIVVVPAGSRPAHRSGDVSAAGRDRHPGHRRRGRRLGRPGSPGLGRRRPRHRRAQRRRSQPRRGTPRGHDGAVRRRQSVSRLPGRDGGRSRRLGGERPARGGSRRASSRPADARPASRSRRRCVRSCWRRPCRPTPSDVAPSGPAIVPFYGLAVLALIVQHVGVTLSGLAMLRDRRRGLVEMFRLAPIRSGEMLVGKYLAAGLLTALVTAIVVAAMIAVLHVPLLGDLATATAALGLLIVSRDGARPAHRPAGRLGTPGRAARAPPPARLGVLQRARHRPEPVRAGHPDRARRSCR